MYGSARDGYEDRDANLSPPPSRCGGCRDGDHSENQVCRFRNGGLREPAVRTAAQRLAEMGAPSVVISCGSGRVSPANVIGRVDDTIVVEIARQTEQELRWA